VTLDDAAVERYSRQILLDDVGGRGQERLCATRVTVRGAGTAAAFAARLFHAAGLVVELDDGPLDTLDAVVASRGVVRAREGVVATLVGAPCLACAGDDVWRVGAGAPPAARTADVEAAPLPAGVTDAGAAPPPGGIVDVPAAQALGALVAAEGIRVALGLVDRGRVQLVGVAHGVVATRALPAAARCAACPPVA
jgi:hypothetical protein